MSILGIDPGQNGAIVKFISKEGEWVPIRIWDMPLSNKLTGKGSNIDHKSLREIFIRSRAKEIFLGLITAMHQQGATSAFNYGGMFHTIIGVAVGLGIPVYFVPPKLWRNWGALRLTDKKGSKSLCKRKWPKLAPFLALVKHQDRSDACWIGYVGAKHRNHLKNII